MKDFFRTVLTIAATFLVALATTAATNNALFPLCIDWHDARKRSFAEKSPMLKELGYPGVGHV